MVVVSSLIACSLAHVAFAATVSVFPLGFNPDQSLSGEEVGTGSVGTTYVLSGETASIPFTVTVVQGATEVAEQFDIPSLSLDVVAACVVTDGGNAVCQQVVKGGQSGETQTIVQTVAYSPFEVVVSSGSALPSSTTSSGSSTSTSSSSRTTITALSSTSSSSSSSTSTTQTSAANAREVFSFASLALSAVAAMWFAL